MASTIVIRKRDLHSLKIKDCELGTAMDRLERSLKSCRSRFQVRVYIRRRSSAILIVGEDINDVQCAAQDILMLMNHTVCLERRRRQIGALSIELWM